MTFDPRSQTWPLRPKYILKTHNSHRYLDENFFCQPLRSGAQLFTKMAFDLQGHIDLWGKKKTLNSHISKMVTDMFMLNMFVLFSSNDLWPLRSNLTFKAKSKTFDTHNYSTLIHNYIKLFMSTSEIKCATYCQWPLTYKIKPHILGQFSKMQYSSPMVELLTLFLWVFMICFNTLFFT